MQKNENEQRSGKMSFGIIHAQLPCCCLLLINKINGKEQARDGNEEQKEGLYIIPGLHPEQHKKNFNHAHVMR